MNLFTKSTGETSKGFEFPKFEIIPDKTEVNCNIMSVELAANSEKSEKYKEQGELYLKIVYIVIDGEYKGVTIRQKIYIYANDDSIKDKSIDSIKQIDMISGGKISTLAKNANINDISKISIQSYSRALAGLGLTIKVGVWEIGEFKGNSIRELKPINKEISDEDESIINNEFDSTIPF